MGWQDHHFITRGSSSDSHMAGLEPLLVKVPKQVCDVRKKGVDMFTIQILATDYPTSKGDIATPLGPSHTSTSCRTEQLMVIK